MMQTNAAEGVRSFPPKLLPVVARLASAGASIPRLAPLLRAAGGRLVTAPAKAQLQLEDERMRRPCYLVSGWAYRFTELADGRRQIYDVILPGEGLGVCLQPRPLALTSVVALTRVELMDATELVRPEQLAADPDLARALDRMADLDERRMLAQIARLGRMSALERMAHLLLQLYDRLVVIGAVEKERFALPLTQELLGDLLGLSTVHLNRTVQELRRQKLITAERGFVELLDRAALGRLLSNPPSASLRAIA